MRQILAAEGVAPHRRGRLQKHVEVACRRCGAGFRRKPSVALRQKYCSNRCWGAMLRNATGRTAYRLRLTTSETWAEIGKLMGHSNPCAVAKRHAQRNALVWRIPVRLPTGRSELASVD